MNQTGDSSQEGARLAKRESTLEEIKYLETEEDSADDLDKARQLRRQLFNEISSPSEKIEDLRTSAKNTMAQHGEGDAGEIDVSAVMENAWGKTPSPEELEGLEEGIRQTIEEYGLVENSRG